MRILSLLLIAGLLTPTNLPSPVLIFSLGTGLESTTTATINAAAENTFSICEVWLPGQTGNKTISAAGGGSITFMAGGGNVLANAATEVRLGLQDVAATGLPDGTFDVYKAFIGGTDSITNSVLRNVAMATGTKTVAHGDLIAAGFEMLTRGGADAVGVARVTFAGGLFLGGFPYGILNGAQTSGMVPLRFNFDDGTIGWCNTVPLLYNVGAAETSINFNSGSATDEYISTFSFNVPVRVTAVGTRVSGIAVSNDFEAIVYTTPYGTPVAHTTRTFNGDELFDSPGMATIVLNPPIDLAINTKIGIAARATSVNNITWEYRNLTSGFEILKDTQPFATVQMAGRADQTGAFVETQTYHLPVFAVWISAFEGGSGAGGAFTFGQAFLIRPMETKPRIPSYQYDQLISLRPAA